MTRPTHASKRAVQFVADWEGFSPVPYNDAAGFATIGYGHLLHRSPVTAADREQWGTITRERALGILAGDMRATELAVLEIVRPPFAFQWRFDALVSFVFNLGAAPIEPGHKMGDALASRSRKGAGAAFGLYVNAGGRELPGLVARRKAERRLFLYGRYR